MDNEIRIKALAKELTMELDEAEKVIEDGDYLVLTDSEADKQVKTYILDSVWAFNPDFLSAHTVDGVDADHIKAIQENEKCEDNNALISRLIEDKDHFVKDAIACDGRGHFLSGYDGEELELDNNLFAYRVN